MVKQNKYTPEYKKDLLKSIIQAIDKTARQFTRHEIEQEIQAERFTIMEDKLILTGYAGHPTFRLENPPIEELLMNKNSPVSSDMDIEGEMEIIG